MRNWMFILLIIMSFLSTDTFAQDPITTEPQFEVNRVYQYIEVSEDEMRHANTLMDLHSTFPKDWIKTYLSVEVTTIHSGRKKSAKSRTSELSLEQKDLINSADAGEDISVIVKYIPENDLKQNDPRELDFKIAVSPAVEASYPAGNEALLSYLREKAIDQIPNDLITGYALAAVQFTVNEQGHIRDVHVVETTSNPEIDKLLVDAIQDMPCWKPAAYSNGVKHAQQFVLTVGNMKSCTVNTLNIRKELFRDE